MPRSAARGLKAVCGMMIAAGIVLRFAYLTRKVFWIDESTSVQRVSGVSDDEILSAFAKSAGVPASSFETYRRPGGSWRDTVARGIAEDPRMPPLYFLALRSWLELFGSSIAASRAFSAFLGVLAIFAMFRFAALLFPGTPAAWAAAAVVAVSPFHLRFSQEARPYALWTLLLLLGFEFFLRLAKEPSRKNWVLYVLAAALAAYTHPMTAAAIAAQFAVLLMAKDPPRRSWGLALLSFPAILLLSLPWLSVVLTHRGAAHTWYALGGGSISHYLSLWSVNLGRLFLEFSPEMTPSSLVILAATLPLLILIAAAFRHFLSGAAPANARLVLLTSAAAFAILALPDLALSGQRSTIGRFLMPLHLMVQAVIGGYLARDSQPGGRLRLSTLLAGLLVFVFGGLSCCYYVNTPYAWGQGSTAPRVIAEALNAEPRPLLYVDLKENSTADIVTLSYYLKDKVTLKALDEKSPPRGGRGPVFFYTKTGSLAERMAARKIRLEPVSVPIQGPPDAALYRLVARR